MYDNKSPMTPPRKITRLIPPGVTPAVFDDQMPSDEDRSVLEDMKVIEKKIEKLFPPDFVQVLKRLAYYLSNVGLEFDEACKMVRFSPEDMKKKIEKFPVIQDLVDTKILEYKMGLIKTVSAKGLGGDEKMAMWLLERRFPGEFNPKKGSGSGNNEDQDLLGMAIEYVRKTSTANPLIKEESGRAFIIKKNSAADTFKTINDVLA